MNPISKEAQKIPLFLSDFFCYLHTQNKRRLKIFLCGQEAQEHYFDLRHNIVAYLKSKMGCDAFLGEQINDLKIVTVPEEDHLSIEVAAAKKSRLVVVFLESPGTISELTAFALSREVNSRLLVFNNRKYKDCKSFINQGPLKLLKSEQIVYYDPLDRNQLRDIIIELDYAIARCWAQIDIDQAVYYNQNLRALSHCYPDLGFEDHMVLFAIYATFPVRPAVLKRLLPVLSRRTKYDEIMARLKDNKLVELRTRELYPAVGLSKLAVGKGLRYDISKARMRLLGRDLR